MHFLTTIISLSTGILDLTTSFLLGSVIVGSISFVLYKKNIRKHQKVFTNDVFNIDEQLHSIIDNLTDGIYIKNTNNEYVIANRYLGKMFNIKSLNSIYGKSKNSISIEERYKDFFEEDGLIVKGKIPYVDKVFKGNIDNKAKSIHIKKIPLRSEDGKITGILSIFNDLTGHVENTLELQKKTKSLEKERNLLRVLIDHMPDVIYIKDAECKFLDGNPEQIKVTKAGSYENLIGKTDYDFYPKEIAEVFYKDDQNILRKGTSVINKEELGFDADGNIRVISTTKIPFRDKKGNILGLVGIGRDITKQKEVEEELKEQKEQLQEINVLLEERQEEINQQASELGYQNEILEKERTQLRTLIDNIPDVIYFKDLNSKFITVNKKMMGVFKVENLDDVIGKTDNDFYGPELADIYLEDDKKIIESGNPIIGKHEKSVDENGNEIVLLTSKVPFKNLEGEVAGIIGIGRDITELKKAQEHMEKQAEELQEFNALLEEKQAEIQQQSDYLSEQNETIDKERNLLRTLIDNIPDYIYIKDKESRFILLNKKGLASIKMSIEEAIGKKDTDVNPNKEVAEQYYEDEQRIISSGEAIINKEEIGSNEDGTQRFYSATKVPFYNANGEIAGIVGISRDITKQKMTEKQLIEQTESLQEVNVLLEERQEHIEQQTEELNSQAENLKKMNTQLEHLNNTKNKFFSIIAHDLKNPFQAILGFSEILIENKDEYNEEQVFELIQMIKTSSESAYNLLENLLHWARTQTERINFKPDYININEIIEQNIKLNEGSAENKKISITNATDNNCIAYADKNMINLVLRNLISNAIKFTGNGGNITVSCTDYQNENTINVSVADTGIGIPEENIDKLFRIEDYFTTTGTNGEVGTGLGLIICKEFIQKNNGKFSINSKENKGTTFSFELPKDI